MGTASSMASFGLQAWMDARLDGSGRVQLSGDSDSALTRGLVAVLMHSLSGLTPEEVLAVEPASLAGLVSIGPLCCCCNRLRCYHTVVLDARSERLFEVKQQRGSSCLLMQGLGPSVLTPSRVNGFANMLEAARRRTRMLTADLPTFPSLLITQEGVTAQVRPARTAMQH